ncbi:helix-turn-helix domain-containing protein [Rhodobacter capsulatus]|uniref:helix-turn-helix domain-containing protein n=1 Tax=Rhodobacter capsulatus TaxID=1061 RepID=UPI0003D35F63|nr:helix-turn-helix transcriptional regulator [Rhodobacter capsulatus]ETD89843.1 hypothetical protein U713_07540 [Rhodobacter capsulatus YW2]
MTPANLTTARQRLGLTQAGLAPLVGYSRDQIGRMEGGHTPIPVALALAVRALCILGADPAQWPDMREPNHGLRCRTCAAPVDAQHLDPCEAGPGAVTAEDV